MKETESGFIEGSGEDVLLGGEMMDPEILSTSSINIIAKGRRYGRNWLLKGLIPELRDSPTARGALRKEFEIHSRLLHPNIVRVASLEEIPGLGLCIVEEWIEGATLSRLLREGKLSKKERRRLMREIISTTGYIHSRGVVDRDLKPDNIMVRKEGGEVVLIDFGLADTGDYTELKQAAGTRGYISPEQLTEGGARVTDDIYSLGVIMRELTPEYSRIANLSTGPLAKRPRDTAALLRMLDRTDRRPKLIAWGVAVALLAAGVGAGLMQMRSISSDTAEIQVKIDTLTNSNKRNALRVDELEHLLYKATGRMVATEMALSVAEEDRGRRRRAVTDAYRKIETEYIAFDRLRIPHFKEIRDPILIDSMKALYERCDRIVEGAYDLKRFPELVGVDSAVMKIELRNLHESLQSLYIGTWNSKLTGESMRRQRTR